MVLNAFLMSTLDRKSWYRFFIWTAVATILYVVYGVHASHHGDVTSVQREVEGGVAQREVELASNATKSLDKEELWKFQASS